MTYEERFKSVLKKTAIGFVIGLVVSVVICISMKIGKPALFISNLVLFTILIGSLISMIICAKSGTSDFMNGTVARLWSGVKTTFFGSIFAAGGGGALIFVFGLVKLIIGLIVLIPVMIYMAISFFVNLIYLGIMFLMEKNGKLASKEDLCVTLDKIAPIVSLVLVIIFFIAVFSS